MKRSDLIFSLAFLGLLLPFVLIEPLTNFYVKFNGEHPILLAYVKFAVLATMGEMLGLRIRTGVYDKPGFGLLPRAFVWGFLGISVHFAFTIFANGTPALVQSFGIAQNEILVNQILYALFISLFLNIFYAPVLMTFHKITDMHIEASDGKFGRLFRSFPVGEYFVSLDWKTQWHFVFKKTIILFWIPAQTFTFMMPEGFRVLIAALLGFVLGVLLSVAGTLGKPQAEG